MSVAEQYPGVKHGKVSRRDDNSVADCAGPGPNRCEICNAERQWQMQWFTTPAVEMEDLPSYEDVPSLAGQTGQQVNVVTAKSPQAAGAPAAAVQSVAGFKPGDLFTTDGRDAWEVTWIASVPMVCFRNLREGKEQQVPVGSGEMARYRRLAADQPQPSVESLMERLAKLEAMLAEKNGQAKVAEVAAA